MDVTGPLATALRPQAAWLRILKTINVFQGEFLGINPLINSLAKNDLISKTGFGRIIKFQATLARHCLSPSSSN
jgi:hypothetical protein